MDEMDSIERNGKEAEKGMDTLFYPYIPLSDLREPGSTTFKIPHTLLSSTVSSLVVLPLVVVVLLLVRVAVLLLLLLLLLFSLIVLAFLLEEITTEGEGTSRSFSAEQLLQQNCPNKI